MSRTADLYAKALYDLMSDEGDAAGIMEQMQVLQESFRTEPGFVRLLADPSVSKQERIGILDSCFREQVHPYVLNFLKLLTEKGMIRLFPDICRAYTVICDEASGILPVNVTTAAEMNDRQKSDLTDILARKTGMKIRLSCRVDSALIGGIRLDYAGKQIDGSLQKRLDDIRSMLKSPLL